MDTLEQKNVKISSVEDVNWGIKIKSDTGEVFNIPKTIKDSDKKTKAFEVLEVLQGFGMGMTKCFKYVTVPSKVEGRLPSRYVRLIEEPQEQLISEEQLQNQTNQTIKGQFPPAGCTKSLRQELVKEEKPNWDDINFGKCKHQFLLEIFKKADNPEAISLQATEQTAEEWAEMSMRMLKDTQELQPAYDEVKEEITGDQPPY